MRAAIDENDVEFGLFFSGRSSGAGSSRSNGLEVKMRNDRKPIATRPITPSTRADTVSGSCPEKRATAAFQIASISTHSSSEPSCEPQTAM